MNIQLPENIVTTIITYKLILEDIGEINTGKADEISKLVTMLMGRGANIYGCLCSIGNNYLSSRRLKIVKSLFHTINKKLMELGADNVYSFNLPVNRFSVGCWLPGNLVLRFASNNPAYPRGIVIFWQHSVYDGSTYIRCLDGAFITHPNFSINRDPDVIWNEIYTISKKIADLCNAGVSVSTIRIIFPVLLYNSNEYEKFMQDLQITSAIIKPNN